MDRLFTFIMFIIFFSPINAQQYYGRTVGYSGTILNTTNAGTNWISQSSGTSNNLYSVHFINTTTGWAVGQFGRILKTTNGGTNWINQSSGTSNNLQSLFFINATTGWAVGWSGKILKTTNGGTNWTSQSSGTTIDLYSIHFINSTTGWAAGWSGKILKTTNGGTNWTSQSSGITSDLYSVYFINETTGWVVGWSGKILKTINGGTNWISQSSGTSLDLRSICIIPDSVTGVSDELINEFSDTIILRNFPNPFNPITTISYSIPNFGTDLQPVKLVVYNMLGEKVVTLVNEEKGTGYHSVKFNASNLPSGIYIYTLQVNDHTASKKMLLLK